ncbi:WXG100 family type VII secretion target [Mycobacterium camsae]|uniref:WXG100 family type VII secretion target n=1 Tax=Mycobacterium gordonae TaxID=1778 RepID=UPI001981BB0B|nr:WXG100 family type VII secretion target [Mycobacterium gordonae]
MATESGNAGPVPELSIDPAGVITAAKSIDEVNTEIEEAFKRLKREAEAVIKGSWTGAAADKVHDGWREWQDGVGKITQALDQVTGLVAQAAHRFEQSDEAN